MAVSYVLNLGDCLGPGGMATLADKSVDHVVTDPPYEAEAHTLQRRIKRGPGTDEGRVTVVAPLSFDPITTQQRLDACKHFARIARRWVIVFCQAEAVASWREAMTVHGLIWKRSCIWLKPDAMPQLTGDRPGTGFESIAVAHAPGKSRWNGGGKHGVWRFGTNKGNGCAEHEDRHPTQKPEALMESLIRDFTDPGDLVLDPFAGHATTGVAAIRHGRRFVGWERDPAFHAVASKRLAMTKEQLQLAF